MAYGAHGGHPPEYASKIGYLKLIDDPVVRKMMAAFEAVDPNSRPQLRLTINQVSLDRPLEQVVTVDGSSITIPNLLRPTNQFAWVKVAAQLFKLETLRRLEADPMMDLRDSAQLRSETTHHQVFVLPLAGLHIPGQTVNESLRESIRIQFHNHGLDQTIKDLIFRVWSSNWPPQSGRVPSQLCIDPGCSEVIEWSTRFADSIDCPSCGTRHYVVDYLALTRELSEDRPRSAIIGDLRALAEVLTLFKIILAYREPAHRRWILEHTLFLLDGPLLLRAALSRLVEPIRDFLETQRWAASPVYLAGVEKEGDLRGFTSAIAEQLAQAGNYFLPTQKFYCEQIAGTRFNPGTYENRVNFGAKISARLGSFHTVALNIPTGRFLTEPKPSDLLGAREIMSTLSRLVSIGYQDALIPLVLINEQASIAPQAAAEPLQAFMDRVLKGEHL